MREISRRDFCRTLGGIFVPAVFGVGGCGTISDTVDEVSDFDPSDIDTYIENYVDDISMPSQSDDPYAQKLYSYSGNVLNDPRKLLFIGDFDYAEFQISKESPLEFVVGFAKEFSRVNIGWYGPDLYVEGYAANAFTLAKGKSAKDKESKILAKPIRFVADLSRGESGYANSNPYSEWTSGGDIQIDTGHGTQRYFIFRAEGEGIVGIDYLKAGG